MEKNKVKEKEDPKSMLIIEIFTLIVLVLFLISLIDSYFNGWFCLFSSCFYGMQAVGLKLMFYWPVSIFNLLCLLYQVYFITNYKKVKEEYKNGKSSENEEQEKSR